MWCWTRLHCYLQRSVTAEEWGLFLPFHSLAERFLSPAPPPSDRNTTNTPWDTLSCSSFSSQAYSVLDSFSSNSLPVWRYKMHIYIKSNSLNRKTQSFCSLSVSNRVHKHLALPFPASSSLSCAPSPAASSAPTPPAAAPSASPAHPAVTSADLRPAYSGPGPAASAACSPLNPAWYSRAAAVHSETWSPWTEHTGQFISKASQFEILELVLLDFNTQCARTCSSIFRCIWTILFSMPVLSFLKCSAERASIFSCFSWRLASTRLYAHWMVMAAARARLNFLLCSQPRTYFWMTMALWCWRNCREEETCTSVRGIWKHSIWNGNVLLLMSSDCLLKGVTCSLWRNVNRPEWVWSFCGVFSYLPVNPAGIHSSGVSLDGDDSLSHSQIGPSFPHHTILFLTGEDRTTETQIFSVSENISNTAVHGILGLLDCKEIYLSFIFLAWLVLESLVLSSISFWTANSESS